MRSLYLLVLTAVGLLATTSTAEAQGRRFPVLGAICHPFQTVRMIRSGVQMSSTCQCANCPGNSAGTQAVASAGSSCPACQQWFAPSSGCPGGVCPSGSCPGGVCPRQSYYGIDAALALGADAGQPEPSIDAEAEARARRVRVAFALAAR